MLVTRLPPAAAAAGRNRDRHGPGDPHRDGHSAPKFRTASEGTRDSDSDCQPEPDTQPEWQVVGIQVRLGLAGAANRESDPTRMITVTDSDRGPGC